MRSGLLFSIFFIVFCSSFAIAKEEVRALEKRYALVIGNNAYKELDGLDNSVNDALALGARLGRLDFVTIVKSDINSKEAKTTLAEFEKTISPGSAVFFYFSGHGVQIDGHNYLIMSDFTMPNLENLDAKSKKKAIKERIYTHSILLDDVVDIFQKKKVKTNIVILDACRKSPSKELEAEGLAGLDALDADLARQVLGFATSPGKVSHSLTKSDKNSLYTKYLLTNIDKENTPVDQMLKSVHKSVYEFSKKVSFDELKNDSLTQMPWINSSLVDDFFMKISGPVSLVGNEIGDTAMWYEVKNSNDIGKIKEYINKYPNGMYILAAKKKVAELNQVKKESNEIRPTIYKFSISKIEADRIIDSPYFFSSLDKYLLDSQNPIEEIKSGIMDKSRLAKAWYCALATHDRYRVNAKIENASKICSDESILRLPIGQFLLGRAHFFGREVKEDKVKAVELIKKSALAGNALAQNFLGDLLYEGISVTRNYNDAFKWYIKAAKSGYVPAMHSVALAYSDGNGAIQNDFEAVEWYKKAAKSGYPWSQNNLAVHLINGKGSSTDVAEATKLIQASVLQNNPQGKILMARLYETGVGMALDKIKAKELYLDVLNTSNDRELKDVAEKGIKRIPGPTPSESAVKSFFSIF